MTSPYGLIADIHLHPWTAFASVDPVTGMNTRLLALHRSISEACAGVQAAGGNTVVIAGDVFHVRGSVSPTVLNSTKDLLDAWARKGMRFSIIPGNHDLEGKHSTRLGAAVTALAGLETQICDTTTTQFIGGNAIVVVPWFEDVKSLTAEIEAVAARATAVGGIISKIDLILHAPIDGVIFGLPDHGLSADYLGKLGFKRVFAGHYHNHKDFGNGVFSIGAIAHHTWSDVDTVAGYLLVYPDRVVQVPTSAPLFVGVDSGATEAQVKGNYVRANLNGSPTMKEVAELRKQFEDWGALGSRIDVLRAPARVRPTVAGVAATGSRTVEQSIAAFITGKENPNAATVISESLRVLSLAA